MERSSGIWKEHIKINRKLSEAEKLLIGGKREWGSSQKLELEGSEGTWGSQTAVGSR